MRTALLFGIAFCVPLICLAQAARAQAVTNKFCIGDTNGRPVVCNSQVNFDCLMEPGQAAKLICARRNEPVVTGIMQSDYRPGGKCGYSDFVVKCSR
jgi:hypothetical protein